MMKNIYRIGVTAILLLTATAGMHRASGQSKIETKTITAAKGPGALFLTPDEGTLYVANAKDTFISVIDTQTDKVVQKIDGADYPQGFTRLGNSNLLAVSARDKGIDVINFNKHRIERSQKYEHNLGGITSTRDGKTLFVVATEVNRVFKIDAQTLQILDEYITGNGPHDLGISKNESKLYVTNSGEGTISIIDARTGKSDVIKTGGRPEMIHASQDRARLFISNFSLNKVYILDSDPGKIIHEITGLDGPEGVALSASEEILYIVNSNSSKVTTYDAKTYKKRPETSSVGSKPVGIVSARGNSRLYVSNYGDNTVTTVALTTKKERDPASEILVKFKPGTQESQITGLASQIGLEQVKTIPALGIYVFRITSTKSRQSVIADCEKQPFVEYAEPNQTVGAHKGRDS